MELMSFLLLFVPAVMLVSMAVSVYFWRRKEKVDEGIRVQDLYIYPLKSARGHRVKSAQVVRTGFKWDRKWMVINSTGRFHSQRQNPLMCLIETELKEEGDSVSLVLRGHGKKADAPEITIPMVTSKDPSAKLRRVVVWRTTIEEAVDQGDAAAAWIQEFLGEQGLRLVFFDDHCKRVVEKKWRISMWSSPQTVGFADGFPFLMAGQASLDDLNARMDTPMPMNRFRPNIVLSGSPAWAEDRMKWVSIGDHEFFGVKKAPRCRLTTTDQEEATQGDMRTDPLKTLKTFRSGHGMVFFGTNMVMSYSALAKNAVINVGDPLYVYERGYIVPFMKSEEKEMGVARQNSIKK